MNSQELFQHAKEDLLASGEHAPIMYVEYLSDGKESLDLLYFASFGAETPMEERKQIFMVGMKWGKEHTGDIEFTFLGFLSEAWVSSVKPGEKRAWRRPHEDPHRREALVAQIVTFMPTPGGKPELKQSFLQAEIVRPAPDVIDLVPDATEIEITQMLFPSYFLAGYAASRRTPQELASLMREVADQL